MTAVLRRTAAAVAVVITTATGRAVAQQASTLPLLDVPFVAQSEQLCGGAAAAMVMRYWGATGVYAENFSNLVARDAAGIRGDDLIRALEARGWQAASVQGDTALIQRSLSERRPPIALIEDRPGRFHYVVIVGWSTRGVVLHDPARAPFRVLDERSFLGAWSRSSNWTLITLPGRDVTPGHAETPAIVENDAAPTAGACGSMVDEAVRQANRGSLDGAQSTLERATARCPNEAAAWRELAGVHVVRKEWTRAAADARRALAIDARDEHAARTLATSLYLAGDDGGALDAWNIVGEPTIDLVEIRGLERTRFNTVSQALRLPAQTRLTSRALTRAARRLDALPAAMGTRVAYTPRDNGLVEVDATVIERPLLPTTPLAGAAIALRAATDRELRLNVASPTGGGELWHADWRWWTGRQRIAVGLDAPAPFGGTWGVAAVDDTETFGATTTTEERRKQLAFTTGDWLTPTLAWEGRVALDRWSSGRSAGLAGGLQYRTVSDRLMLGGSVGRWLGAEQTWTASAAAEWRSAAVNQGAIWLAAAGVDAAGDGAPMMLWSGAGTGQGRTALLRAHSLLDDGVIRDGVFGPRLGHGTVEWRLWGRPVARVLRIAHAVFVDAARAWDAPAFADRRAHIDAGAGVRLAIPGAGVLRADLARGLRDGQMALSFGWVK